MSLSKSTKITRQTDGYNDDVDNLNSASREEGTHRSSGGRNTSCQSNVPTLPFWVIMPTHVLRSLSTSKLHNSGNRGRRGGGTGGEMCAGMIK